MPRPRDEGHLRLKFGSLQGVHWMAFATVTAFAVIFVREKGISAAQIGLMLALNRLASTAGQFFWGAICDRTQKNRAFYLAQILLALAMSLLFYFAEPWPAILAFYTGMGFLQTPAASNLDTWMIKRVENGQKAYGRLRGVGSTAYSFFVLLYGVALEKLGYGLMPWAVTSLTALLVGLVLLTPESEKTPRAEKARAPDSALWKNRPYLFLLAILGLSGLASMPIWQFKILIHTSLGATVAYQGYDGFASSIAQAPAMMIGGYLALKFHLSPEKRIVGGIAFGLLEAVLCFVARSPNVVLIASVFGGGCFGLMLSASREMVRDLVPMRSLTTAQGLCDAMYLSVSGFVSGLAGGAIFDAYGPRTLTLLCLALQSAALLLAAFWTISRQKTVGNEPGRAAEALQETGN